MRTTSLPDFLVPRVMPPFFPATAELLEAAPREASGTIEGETAEGFVPISLRPVRPKPARS